jgi:molybdopterin/thiamine biosynthesis adenylyltransferase
VSFNLQYLERACAEAGCGLAFLHSHPGPGWQGMSRDDVRAELRMAGAVVALTDLPLLGMTVGSDGTWSARMWERSARKEYQRRWCHSVRVVGETLGVSFTDALVPPPTWRQEFKRTVTVWGEEAHGTLARLRVGIVGLGSVGSVVAEALARMGIERFALIDFDEVQRHNLDRLLGASRRDLGKRKVDVAARQILRAATAEKVNILRVPHAVTEEAGYRAALDCDVIFSCVDRPWPRQVLNHLAYAHLIPVIDGGIQVRFRRGRFTGADWQVQTVGPGRRCLECLQAFYPGDVATEREGKLDDSSYLAGLPADHRFKRNESVFPFSANLATLEVMHLVALATVLQVSRPGRRGFAPCLASWNSSGRGRARVGVTPHHSWDKVTATSPSSAMITLRRKRGPGRTRLRSLARPDFSPTGGTRRRFSGSQACAHERACFRL